MELYHQGMDDLSIAECLGVSKGVFQRWRRDRDLPAHKHHGGGRQRKAVAPHKGISTEPSCVADLCCAMTASQLVRLLSVVDAGHPGAVIQLDGRVISGLEISIRMDADGRETGAFVELKTEEARQPC